MQQIVLKIEVTFVKDHCLGHCYFNNITNLIFSVIALCIFGWLSNISSPLVQFIIVLLLLLWGSPLQCFDHHLLQSITQGRLSNVVFTFLQCADDAA